MQSQVDYMWTLVIEPKREARDCSYVSYVTPLDYCIQLVEQGLEPRRVLVGRALYKEKEIGETLHTRPKDSLKPVKATLKMAGK